MLPKPFFLNPEVAGALRRGEPVVALESAVITHGLPRPHNLELARALEETVRSEGAQPATIALLDGKIHVGLNPDALAWLANQTTTRKISRRDFGLALARRETGGTTVAATIIAARAAGIKVFATGGIGGVHREAPFDVSADLLELGRTPLLVVCAGAKAILDLPATLEVLETQGVPVLGFRTDQFPAFYSAESSLPVTQRIETPGEAAEIARAQWEMGIDSAVLLAAPPPPENALSAAEMEAHIQVAIRLAQVQGIHGAALTPFLLERMGELTGGASLKANLALLKNNARIAAQVAVALSKPPLYSI